MLARELNTGVLSKIFDVSNLRYSLLTASTREVAGYLVQGQLEIAKVYFRILEAL